MTQIKLRAAIACMLDVPNIHTINPREFSMGSDDKDSAIRQARGLVQSLATQTNTPLEEAREAYEMQFELLERKAKVKIYLPILAARHAREILSRH